MAINSYIKNGKKLYEVRVKIRDSLGNQVCRRKAGISSIRKAQEIEFDLKAQLKCGSGENDYWTWELWHSEFLRKMQGCYQESTISDYSGGLKKWLPKDWDKRRLTSFTRSDIQETIFELMEEASDCTKKCTLKKVKRVFQLAVEEGILSKNPAQGIQIKLPEPKQLVLNVNEAEILLHEARRREHPFYSIWTVALLTGLRSGEMYTLRFSDIDFEANLIHVTKQWTSKDGLHPTKNRRNRVVPISSDLKHFLRELKLEGSFKEVMWDKEKKEKILVDDLVLPRSTEWRHGEQARVLEGFCETIGITKVKFHDLRATFITNMLAQGVPLVTVMAIVGHSRMSTTDRYLRLAGVNVKDSTQKLGYRLPTSKTAKVIRLEPK